MFNYTCAVVSAAALLIGTPAQVGAQDSPPPPSSVTVPRKPPSPTLPNRVFIDVNGGFQSGTHTFSDTRNDAFYGETASWTADYETKSGPAFDVSGGVRVWRNLVASVAYSRFTDTGDAGIQGAVPHPFFFNRNRAIAGEAVGLKQEEDVIHMSAMWAVPVNRSLDLRVFGGPSLYRIQRDLVEDIVYTEDGYPYDTASFDSARIERVDANAWGFHVGGDVTWMFTQTVGLGAMARFSHAETDISSPANGDALAFRFGGLQFGGGVRFRFGRISARKEGTTRPLPPVPEAPLPPEPEAPSLPEPETPISKELPEPTDTKPVPPSPDSPPAKPEMPTSPVPYAGLPNVTGQTSAEVEAALGSPPFGRTVRSGVVAWSYATPDGQRSVYFVQGVATMSRPTRGDTTVPSPGAEVGCRRATPVARISVIAPETPVFVSPKVRAEALIRLPAGAVLDTTKTVGSWYLVNFTDRLGTYRAGYVHCSDVRASQ